MSTLKLRKIFAAFTLTTLVASLFVVAPATQAAPPSWWTEGTELLDQVDAQYSDENQVEADKCRVAAVLTAALGLEENPSAAAGYIDIPAGCDGVAGAVIAAGIVKGEANTGEIFGAGSFINRAVFATMLSRAFNLDQAYPNATLTAQAEADLAVADWAKPYFAQVMAAGIYRQTRPADQINIYEITTAVSRAMNPGPVVDPGQDGGGLEVTISDNTPQGRTVPGGVQNAHIATFEFEANEDDVELISIEFSKGGIADDDALDNIALFTESGQRVSKAKSFRDSDDTATVNFLSGGFTIEAGESMDLLVFGEVGSVVANPDLIADEFFVEIQSADDIVSNASSTSVRDARSETMRIGSADAAELALSAGASSPSVSVGEQNVEIYEFEMENNASDETDIIFYGITLEAEGSFDEEDDVMNYALYLDGDMVASTEMGADGYVSFLVEDADGYVIEDGETVDAVVRGDIMSGANETISFGLDSELDVFAADASFGTGAKITGNITGNTTTIDAGEITLVAIDAEKDEFTEDTDEFVLGTIRVTSNAGRNLELQEFRVDIEKAGGGVGTNASDLIDQVEVRTPFGTFDLDSTGAAAPETYEDDSIDVLLPEGETFDMVVTADIKSGLTFAGTETLELSLPTINGVSGTSYFYVEELGDDEAVEDITPSSLSFNSVNAEVASLEVTALTQSDISAVIGSNDVNAFNFRLEASDSESLMLNDLNVGVIAGAPATADNQTLSRLSLYVDSIEEANLLDSQSGSRLSGGSVEFDSLDLVIEAGEEREMFIVVDFVDNPSIVTGTVQLELISADVDDEDNDQATVFNGVSELSSANRLASNREITITASGTLAVQIDGSDSAANRNRLVLGGTTSQFVGGWEFLADDEDILIEDITIANELGTTLSEGVRSVELYANDKVTLLGSEVLTAGSDSVTFENIDVVVPEDNSNGDYTIYAKVVAQTFGEDEAGVLQRIAGDDGTATASEYQLSLTVDAAEGVSSGDDLGALATLTDPNTFVVAPVKINNMSFLNTFTVDGQTYNVPSVLSNGDNNLAIVKIDNAANTNTSATGSALKTVIRELNVVVDKYTNGAAGTAVNSFSIQRLTDASEGKEVIPGAAVAAGDPTSSIENLDIAGAIPVDSVIEPGDTAYFLISGNVTKDGTSDNDDVLQLSLENFETQTDGTESIIFSADAVVNPTLETGGPEYIDIARFQTRFIESRQLVETN